MRQGDARILVVDDEPKICTMLRAALKRDDCRVEVCGDGAQALERFQADPFDIVISDLRMPGVGGCELIRQIKDDRPATFVVAITGHATIDTAVQALQHGADDYITKPFDIRSLRRVIAAYQRSRELLAPAAASRPQVAAQAPAAPEEAARPIQASAARASPAAPSAAREVLEANRRLEARVAELIAIQDVTRAIAAELDLDRLLDTCLERVAGAIRARSAAILTLGRDEQTLVVRARRGRDRHYLVGERRQVGEGIAGWVAEHRVALLIPDLNTQPAFREIARADGYEAGSFLAVPLELPQPSGPAEQETSPATTARPRPARLLGVLSTTDTDGERAFGEGDLRLVIALSGHIAIAIANARLYEAVRQSTAAALQMLAQRVEERDGFSRGHARRVADYAVRAARELGLSRDELRTLRQAALVHDIGRITVSDSVVGRPGPLTEEEFAALREHPVQGERVVSDLGFFDAARPLIRHHHERWDGQGYPDGLKGREVDPLTRILTIADAFDAMTSPRPHRPARRRDAALAEVASLAGKQFDPNFVDPFGRAVVAMA